MSFADNILRLADHHLRPGHPVGQPASISYSESVLREAQGILEEAMRARQRCAADLAHHQLDQRAFDEAVLAFDQERHRALPAESYLRDECAYRDAELEALEAFLATYLEEAGK